ncbi:MAG: hypothetical protein H7263_14490 [Candidatus Sericytochromatia bacterium]|nr:hypothetical protein [Candidatus Sericytochromatia bacterium]
MIKDKISKSRFSRRLNKLKDLILVVFKVMSEIGKSEADYFQMNAFPLKVCHNVRIRNCKIVNGEI